MQAFVKGEKPEGIKHLFSTKYVRGAQPVIKLYDADGEVEETMDITKWTTDQLTEFLLTHLVSDQTPHEEL